MSKLRVVLDPEKRQKYLNMLLKLDGLSIDEDKKGCYCPISLTNTPDELKSQLKERQEILKRVLIRSSLNFYDPSSSVKYNPDFNRDADHTEVYLFDSARALSARFFSGHCILPSTGFGNEAEKARIYNRISVILMDKNIRVSRMQPFRAIYLQYGNFDYESDRFVDVFKMLQDYEPGMGFNGNAPVLLGFSGSKVVDLEEIVYKEFPNLQYHYDGKMPILKLRAENPELFYESRIHESF